MSFLDGLRGAFWLALAVALPATSAAAQDGAPRAGKAGAEAQVRWRGKSYAESKLPEEAGPGAHAALRAWAELGQAEGWRFDLDEGGRVLLVTVGRSSKAPAYLRLLERVVAELDLALPAAPRPEPVADAPAPQPDPDVIPEDPEEEPVEPIDGPEQGPTSWTFSWGTAERHFDQDTVVLFVLRDESGVDPILARLAELQPYLEGWIPVARQLAGWALEQPLVGLCYEMPSGVEEWNVENEIAHRSAELLCLRRFGPLPAWLLQGFAWSVEMRLMKSIYCFPGRTGFVWASEHTSWPADLRQRFTGKEETPLAISELDALQRGKYDERAAPLSWGFVEYLRVEHAAALPLLADALRSRRDLDDRSEHGDGNWSRDPDYRMPAAVQESVLLERCGAGVLDAAPAFMANLR